MSGLILPGQPPRRESLTIHVPRGYDTDTGPRQVGECYVCGKVFYEGESAKAQAHMGYCARQHIDEIRARKLEERLPVFGEDAWDPEISEHMRKVGERMRREGRLTVRRSERAGF